MPSLREIRLKTDCKSCINKCCSQPYDWVYLTAEEIESLKTASGLSENEFVIKRQNPSTGHNFRTLVSARYTTPGHSYADSFHSIQSRSRAMQLFCPHNVVLIFTFCHPTPTRAGPWKITMMMSGIGSLTYGGKRFLLTIRCYFDCTNGRISV